MSNWLDRMIARMRDAKTPDEARTIARDYLDPATGKEIDKDDDGDTHIHVHMPGKEGDDKVARDDLDPDTNGGGNGGNDVVALAARVAALEEAVETLMGDNGDEEEVEMEDPDTKDAKRYVMRRRGKLKTKDEDIPVPERNPDIIGETDLPGIEDLDKRMTAGDRRKVVDSIMKRDSVDMEDTWQAMLAASEILVPGSRAPTFDARLTASQTAKRMCSHRRTVLDKALKDDETREIIAEVVGIKTADDVRVLSCDSLRLAYTAASGAVRAHRNSNQRRDVSGAAAAARGGKTGDGNDNSGSKTLGQMNSEAREFWSKQKTNGATR